MGAEGIQIRCDRCKLAFDTLPVGRDETVAEALRRKQYPSLKVQFYSGGDAEPVTLEYEVLCPTCNGLSTRLVGSMMPIDRTTRGPYKKKDKKAKNKEKR